MKIRSLNRLVMLTIVLASLVFAGGGCAAGASRLATNLEAGRPQALVAYGTSLTAGGAWVGQLEAALKAHWPYLVTVMNRGAGGASSKWGVDELDVRVIVMKPDTVLIEFAINDAALGSGISVEQARENLTNMVDRILAAKAGTEVVLMTMNRPYDVNLGERPEIGKYYEMYREVAKERGLMLVDHEANWEALRAKDPARIQKYLPDGIHPSPEGCREVITPALLKALGVPATTVTGATSK